MRIVSDQFLKDVLEVLMWVDSDHIEDCSAVITGDELACDCGADIIEAKTDKLTDALASQDAFRYAGVVQ